MCLASLRAQGSCWGSVMAAMLLPPLAAAPAASTCGNACLRCMVQLLMVLAPCCLWASMPASIGAGLAGMCLKALACAAAEHY